MIQAFAARALSALFIVASLGAAAQAPIRVSGSTTVNAVIFHPHKAAIEAQAGAKIEVSANSSGRGLLDLVAGRSDLAMISSPMASVAAKLNEKPGTIDVSGLRETKIGDSQVVILVHTGNPIKSVSMAQLRDLMGGKVANWKEVGGPDLPITVVTEIPGGGGRVTLEDKVMGGFPVSASARIVLNAPQVALIVKQLPGAIGTGNVRHQLDGVKKLETEKPIIQPLYVVSKGSPNEVLAKIVKAATAVAQ